MIFHNKILLSLIGCIIANSCFADGVVPIFDPGNFQVTPVTPIIPPFMSTGVVCQEDYYVAYCGNMEISFENIMTVLKNNRYLLVEYCWATDGSLTTAKHYQNIRAIFGIVDCSDGCNDIDKKIQKMDGTGNSGSVGNCGAKNTLLKNWMQNVHTACMTAAQNGTLVCLPCPDDGVTDTKTEYAGAGTTATWKTFNTIANCYITGGEDERGEFELEQPTPSTNPPTKKCYYSKE